jgi:hypothetical protein
MCAKGFKVSRPSRWAVWSPKDKAAQPCANSWIIEEKIIIMYKNTAD